MGAGYKIWTRERLEIADMQTLLQDQTVMVFASASARDAAIPVPVEGMVCYLKSTGQFLRRGSSAWAFAFGNFGSPAATPAAMQTGYVVATGRNPGVWVDGSNWAHLVGAYTNSGAFTPPAATPAFILGAGFRPPVLMDFPCASSIGTYNLEITTAGACRVLAPLVNQPAGTVFGVDGVHFPIGN